MMSGTPETNNNDQAKFEEFVNKEIRPSLRMHGGDMEIVSFEDNLVKIKYQGACGCCPGAALSTLPMIQEIVKQKYSPDLKVEIA